MSHLRTTPLCVAREGRTIDGRVITRDHILEMAKNYEPRVYGARINKEHIRTTWFDEDLPILGDVVSVSANDDVDGKACLYAVLCPNSHLLRLNERDQKVYFSIEYDVDKVQGKIGAYLFAVAMSDSPASTGTDRIKLCIKNTDQDSEIAQYFSQDVNAKSSYSEFISADFSLDATGDSTEPLVQKVANQFAKLKPRSKDMQELRASIELITAEVVTLATQFADLKDTVPAPGESAELRQIRADFNELKTEISNAPGSNYRHRSASQGAADDNSLKTDC